MKKISFALAGLLFLLSLSGCNQKENIPVSGELFVMSTYVTQKVYGDTAQKAINEVETFLVDCEETFSLYKESSEVSKINRNAGIAPVAVSDNTFTLIQTAKRYSELSEGRFDLTIAPLSTLWAVQSENPHVPSDAEIKDALALVDYRDVILNEANKTVFLKREGMALDLGGVAKGYFCKEIARIYKSYNIRAALVSIGGNIYTYHQKPDGTDFKLGIRNPNDLKGGSFMGVLASHDEVAATSGAYERFFEQDGIFYHHILDLNTGAPSRSDLLSVTVICEDGGLADYLSTTLYLAGSEAIDTYLADDRFAVIVIDKANRVYISPSLRDRFSITDTDFVFAEALHTE